MATKQSTADFVLDQLSNMSNVRVRRMFGEFALYCNEKVVGLICDDTVFVKITPQGKTVAGGLYSEGRPYPGAKPYLQVAEDMLENRQLFTELISVTEQALPTPKPKKRKSKL